MKIFRDKTKSHHDFFKVTVNGVIVKYNGPKDVVIPSEIDGTKITDIGHKVFAEKELTSVQIPNTITSIYDFAFYGNNLKSIVLPDNLKKIGECAFAGNKDINIQINDENSYFKIENKTILSKDETTIHAYFGNEEKYFIKDTVSTIRAFAFRETNILSLYIPDSVETIENAAFDYCNLEKIIVDNKNNYFKVEEGSLLSKDGNIFYGLIGKHKSYVFQNGIKTIEGFSCASNTLREIYLPDSVTLIGHYAFFNNSISEVTLPKSIKFVDLDAFAFNDELHTIKVRGVSKARAFISLLERPGLNNEKITLISDDIITIKKPDERFGTIAQRFNPEFLNTFTEAVNNNNFNFVVDVITKNMIPINIQDFFNTTPLMYASQEGHYQMVKFMLYMGADLSIQNLWGNTALILAAAYGFDNIVELLLDKGADINQINDYGDTALIVASSENQTKVVELLIKRGANTTINNNDGETALSYAQQNNNTILMNLLL